MGDRVFAINSAVEESKIESRARFQLLPQDRWIQDNITEDDILVVSVGGNDIALAPQLPCTVINMGALNYCSLDVCLENACGCALPCDDYLYGCTTGCLSNFCTFPCWGYGYFLHLFGTRVQAYVDHLTSKRRPKAILICMIYYPDEKINTSSWANTPLGLLGYNKNPKRLQLIIDQIFKNATSRISIPGTQVIPVALSQALDGSNTDDYCERVEPSATGGAKMASLIFNELERHNKI
jgi:hypothetical protein